MLNKNYFKSYKHNQMGIKSLQTKTESSNVKQNALVQLDE